MRKVMLVFMSLMLAACSSLLTPRPVDSEYFTTLGGSFLMTLGKNPSKTYEINLLIKKDLPDNTYAVIEFENPENKTLPYISEGPIKEIKNIFTGHYKNVLVLTSPHVTGIKPHTNYGIIISLYSDKSKQELVTRHQQWVSSSYISD